MPYVGGSLALSRRYMSSAELSSLVSKNITQTHILIPRMRMYAHVPHLLRDLLHDVVCDDVSVANALPVAVVIVS